MPELPDIELYLAALRPRIVGQSVLAIRIASPFLLRSVDPPLSTLEGRHVRGLERLGKRIVLALDDDLFVVIHLMISGRLRWKARGAPIPGKVGLAAFDFPDGTLILTEASPKKRASLYVVRGRDGLAAHDPGGIDVLNAGLEEFDARLRVENRTLKRALTDPRLFSGIGNAYSDEILHRARLSPLALTHKLSAEETGRLFASAKAVLGEWTERLRHEAGENFPEGVTAFRPQMAVHGRFGKPCPDCGAPVQRIVYADNETNYCANCQTRGTVLADRALSRLLKASWPRSIDELG